MKVRIALALLLVAGLAAGFAASFAQTRTRWRAATATELEAFLPARAPVEKERIETEMRTATGIVDERGRRVAAVVLITAGYSADGKYSHYLLTDAPLQLGADIHLAPGAYVLGWTRVKEGVRDGLDLHIYDAHTGGERGRLLVPAKTGTGRVEAFRIWQPEVHRYIQIGRYALPYGVD